MNINDFSTSRADINELMSKLREVSNKSSIFTEKTQSNTATSGFDNILSVAKDAISHVNQLQTISDATNSAYISGDGSATMSQVIVATQKSKLAFEGLIAVRNKILESYKEIMNMQI